MSKDIIVSSLATRAEPAHGVFDCRSMWLLTCHRVAHTEKSVSQYVFCEDVNLHVNLGDAYVLTRQ